MAMGSRAPTHGNSGLFPLFTFVALAFLLTTAAEGSAAVITEKLTPDSTQQPSDAGSGPHLAFFASDNCQSAKSSPEPQRKMSCVWGLEHKAIGKKSRRALSFFSRLCKGKLEVKTELESKESRKSRVIISRPLQRGECIQTKTEILPQMAIACRDVGMRCVQLGDPDDATSNNDATISMQGASYTSSKCHGEPSSSTPALKPGNCRTALNIPVSARLTLIGKFCTLSCNPHSCSGKFEMQIAGNRHGWGGQVIWKKNFNSASGTCGSTCTLWLKAREECVRYGKDLKYCRDNIPPGAGGQIASAANGC